MTSEKIQKTARIYALQNAVLFNGKADGKAVTGKVIAALKNESFSPKDIVPVVRAVTDEVNRLTPEQQIKELTKLAPDLLHKEKKERDFSLPELPHAENGKVVTRFPPEPNGYLHIGHAKAAIIDHEYARLYDGRFILRFDDTNPENEQEMFYEVQREDLRWLGITWDKEYNTSDNLETHYRLAEQLIHQGHAYMCDCVSEVVKDGRFHGKPCKCRSISPGETGDHWKEMLTSGELTGAILRLKGDLKSANTAMRDPTLFRVIETPHPLKGTRYRVWPTYDFAGAVEDSISGVTHPFRTKEYELRDEVYFYILSLLNLRKPFLMEFARLSIQGMPVSKRKIKPLIENGQVSGYDDVRLPTLRGLQRRGIVAEAIKQFVLSQGISKAESEVSFSLVEAMNRKILDPLSKRYFFVPNPVKLTVKDAPERTVHLKMHPTMDFGERILTTNTTFFIPQGDVDELKMGDVFRLKDLLNVRLIKKGEELVGEYAGGKPLTDTPKIQWTTENHKKMKLFIPGLLFDANEVYNPGSLQEVDGFAENAVSQVKTGEIIQCERIGFVRVEHAKNGDITGFFAHK
ncbi:MAG: glutamate--tRNA ligase [Methanobacteriota archaeon]